MKVLTILLFMFSFTTHAKECFTLDFPKITHGFKSFQIELPSIASGTGYVTLNNDKDSYSANFWCMKQKMFTHCVGDDDGGSVKVYKDHIVIDFLNFGNPDEDFIEFKGSSRKYTFSKTKCN